jgi:hypothetical protein
MPLTAAEETIIITRALREAGERMMEQAYRDRDSGKLSLDSFFLVSERYQQIQDECNRAVREAAARLPTLPKEVAALGDATKQLEQALKTVTAISDTVNLSAKLVWALGSLVLTIITPSVDSAAMTAAAIVDVGRTIVDLATR